METIDIKKLETAICYLQRIADGNHPVNNMPIEEDTILNNPNVIRCMYFVKEVLEAVRRNDGIIENRARRSGKAGLLEFPLEVLQEFTYKEDLGITKFVAQLNEMIDENVYQKLSYKPISQWLKFNEFLKDEQDAVLKKNVSLPTEKGMKMGIRAEQRTGIGGRSYMQILYGKEIQEYIVENMESILNGEVPE